MNTHELPALSGLPVPLPQAESRLPTGWPAAGRAGGRPGMRLLRVGPKTTIAAPPGRWEPYPTAASTPGDTAPSLSFSSVLRQLALRASDLGGGAVARACHQVTSRGNELSVRRAAAHARPFADRRHGLHFPQSE